MTLYLQEQKQNENRTKTALLVLVQIKENKAKKILACGKILLNKIRNMILCNQLSSQEKIEKRENIK